MYICVRARTCVYVYMAAAFHLPPEGVSRRHMGGGGRMGYPGPILGKVGVIVWG